jgi:hypothetical protein
VSQTPFAVTSIAAAGLVTSNENVTNEDKTPAVSSTPAPTGYFMMPGLFLHPPTASRQFRGRAVDSPADLNNFAKWLGHI